MLCVERTYGKTWDQSDGNDSYAIESKHRRAATGTIVYAKRFSDYAQGKASAGHDRHDLDGQRGPCIKENVITQAIRALLAERREHVQSETWQ